MIKQLLPMREGKIKIAPSLLAADFANMGHALALLDGWGADMVHLDIMDGHFVPNITFGPAMVKALRPLTALPLDAHLMVENPAAWVEPFIEAGADIITVHAEADRHLQRTLAKIRACGARAGVALNPATPLCAVEQVLCDCDLVLLMSVNPGFGGQRFLPQLPDKIAALNALVKKHKVTLEIEVDGGINAENAHLCRNAGASILVAGNAVFGATDPAKTLKVLRG